MPSGLRAQFLVELRIEDSIVAGRSPLELSYLLIGGAAGWTIFQAPGPFILKAPTALFLVALGAAFAFGRIAGRDLTAWSLAIVRFLTGPRVMVYGATARP